MNFSICDLRGALGVINDFKGSFLLGIKSANFSIESRIAFILALVVSPQAIKDIRSIRV